MKKYIYILLGVLVLLGFNHGVSFEAGLMYGPRTVNDSDIKSVYGNGTELFLYIDAQIWRGFTLGVGYGTGYSKDGTIGVYNETTNLKMSGFEIFAAWQFELKKLVPYLKAGYSSVKYEQKTESTFATDINGTESTFIFAGGLKYYVVKKLFLNLEIKYIPLKVSPIDETVDLGGVNYFFGIGYSF